MLIGACGLAVFLLISGHSTTGAVVLGLAVALKGYPILFVLLWLRRHRWRDSVLAVATAGVCTVVPLLLYRGGFFANIRRILQNVRTNEEAYTRVYISYNQSLRGSLRSIASLDLGPVSRFSSTVLTHFGLVAAVSLVLGIFLVLQKTTTLFEQTMVICSLVIVSVDYVAPYAIGVFFVACITLWTEASELPKMWVVVHALLLALLLAPKGFPVTFWSDNFDYGRPTYGSLLGGLTALAVMVCVLSRYLALRMRTNSAVVKVSP
jgi:hypothetical protein